MKVVLSALLLMMSIQAFGVAQEVREFDSDAQKRLFLNLADELRCPKCQNQNIADSNANIAKDLRNKVYKLVREGKDKQEVIDFMVERYGYFVYYKPPVTAGTIILWLAPIGFVLFTLVLIWLKSNRSRRMTDKSAWSESQEQALNDLIAQVEQAKGQER